MELKKICVFCGSSLSGNEKFIQAAEALGRVLAGAGLGLVYGGATVGLMGRLADTVMAAGGMVEGVIPASLFSKEIPHPKITRLITTPTMHERKQKMYDMADGFIALPGGLGTLDELCEVLTWAQLGLHRKPIGLLNVSGYFDHFLQFLERACAEGLMDAKYLGLILREETPEALLRGFETYHAPPVHRWIRRQDR